MKTSMEAYLNRRWPRQKKILMEHNMKKTSKIFNNNHTTLRLMVKALLKVYWFTVAMHQLLCILSEFEAPTNRKERNTYGKI